jgi:hypothetical protein
VCSDGGCQIATGGKSSRENVPSSRFDLSMTGTCGERIGRTYLMRLPSHPDGFRKPRRRKIRGIRRR